VFQLISVLPPETMVAGLAVKELMVGKDWAKQVTETAGAIRARSTTQSLMERGVGRSSCTVEGEVMERILPFRRFQGGPVVEGGGHERIAIQFI